MCGVGLKSLFRGIIWESVYIVSVVIVMSLFDVVVLCGGIVMDFLIGETSLCSIILLDVEISMSHIVIRGNGRHDVVLL